MTPEATKRKAAQDLARFLAMIFRMQAARSRREAQIAERFALIWGKRTRDPRADDDLT